MRASAWRLRNFGSTIESTRSACSIAAPPFPRAASTRASAERQLASTSSSAELLARALSMRSSASSYRAISASMMASRPAMYALTSCSPAASISSKPSRRTISAAAGSPRYWYDTDAPITPKARSRVRPSSRSVCSDWPICSRDFSDSPAMASRSATLMPRSAAGPRPMPVASACSSRTRGSASATGISPEARLVDSPMSAIASSLGSPAR